MGYCATRPEHTGRPFEQLGAPRCDLIGMQVIILRQLRQRLLALVRGTRHLRLKGRAAVAPGVVCSFSAPVSQPS